MSAVDDLAPQQEHDLRDIERQLSVTDAVLRPDVLRAATAYIKARKGRIADVIQRLSDGYVGLPCQANVVTDWLATLNEGDLSNNLNSDGSPPCSHRSQPSALREHMPRCNGIKLNLEREVHLQAAEMASLTYSPKWSETALIRVHLLPFLPAMYLQNGQSS
jgi:TH1 protein